MSRLKRLLATVHPAAIEHHALSLDIVAESTAALRDEVSGLHQQVSVLATQALDARRRVEDLLEACRRDAEARVAMAGLPEARLLSDSLVLDGRPSQRLRVRRVVAGRPVERPLAEWVGVTRCHGLAPDVRALWERLLTYEANCGDGMLRGAPSTILDVPGGVVSIRNGSTLHVAVGQRPAETIDSAAPIVAVPRCAYAFPPRKLRNFGHWLLDCVPQVVALSLVAPDAVYLLPAPVRPFHRSTLLLAGVAERQMVAWDGAPMLGERLLVLESDGRAGGGRPLSPLMELRRLVAPPAGSSTRRARRIYASRGDAKRSRQWVANEPDVEALFASRGFEVLRMAECPLDEQVRIFREADVVAGVSGAGLTNIIFSAEQTHVIVLLTESLIRWYADEAGARSMWAGGTRAGEGQLAALGDSPRFHAHLAAAYQQFCHSFVGPDVLPLDALSAFLDEVLGRVSLA